MPANATDLAGVPLSYIKNEESGVVRLTGRLARPGLLVYGPQESAIGKPLVVYRSEAVVSSPAYLESVRGSLISHDHSFTSVDKGGSGVITTAAYVDGHVAIELMLTDPLVIAEVTAGTRQLSAGYTYDYVQMTPEEIFEATRLYSTDWDTINRRLITAKISKPVWVKASNLVNNHATLVPIGRAGVTCAIDEEIMDETLSTGQEVVIADETVATPSGVTTESEATKLMLALLEIVTELKETLQSAAIEFDTKAFAADRAGYMGHILAGMGIVATDLELSQSMDLANAYCLGFAKARDSALVTKAVEKTVTTTVATDEVDQVEGSVLVTTSTRSAWDKLTNRIGVKKNG